MVNIMTGIPFNTPKRIHHREDEGALEFPSSVSSRSRGLLALRAQNWRAAKKSGPTARDYVQDGLVFQLDSFEAGGFEIALPDGTLPASDWKPLVGVGNVRTWNSKIMVENGVITNYASSSVNYTANIGREITIESYCFRSGGNGWACNGAGYSFFKLGTLSHSRFISPAEAPAGCNSFYQEAWKHMWRIAFVGGRIFISNDDGANQVEFPANAIKGTPNEDADVSTNTSFGGGTATTVNYLPFAFRVYNRILTPSEMAYNYEVDKARFGLA